MKLKLKLNTEFDIDTDNFDTDVVTGYVEEIVEETEDRSIENLTFDQWKEIIRLMLEEDPDSVIDLRNEVSDSDFVIEPHTEG